MQLIWICLCAGSLVASERITVPISQRHVPIDLRQDSANLNKYFQTKHKRDPSIQVPINTNGGAFFVPIKIGTPAQQFSVLVDTGSSLLWVPSTQCSICDTPATSNSACQCKSLNPPFNPRLSSTFSQAQNASTQKVAYAVGAIEGTPATESISLGPSTLKSIPFLLTTKEDKITSSNMNGFGDGILGLAFQDGLDTAKHHSTLPFFLAQQNLLPKNMFSVWLNQSSETTSESPIDPLGGRLILGDPDPSLYIPPVQYFPISPIPITNEDYSVSTSYFYSFPATSLSVNGNTIPARQGTLALLDTGTTLIQMDSATLMQLVTQFNGVLSYNPERKWYDGRCVDTLKLPPIVLNLSGVEFSLSAKEYMFALDGSDKTCFLGIQEYNTQPNSPVLWVLGAVFLQKYYSVYDLENKRVGLALAVDGKLTTPTRVSSSSTSSSIQSLASIQTTSNPLGQSGNSAAMETAQTKASSSKRIVIGLFLWLRAIFLLM